MARPLTQNDVTAILAILDRSSFERFDLTFGSVRIAASRFAPQSPLQNEEPIAAAVITAPLLGVFRTAGAGTRSAPIGPGMRIEDGTAVGTIHVLHEGTAVNARLTGTIDAVLVEDGDFVEYGQPLFQVRLDQTPVGEGAAKLHGGSVR